MRKRFQAPFLILLLSAIQPIKAQRVAIDLMIGQYNHAYYINDEFNGIITQMTGGFDKVNLLIGASGRYLINSSFELQIGFIAYTELFESILFWDTTEEQIFGDWVRKSWTFGGGHFSAPLKLNFIIPLANEFKLTLGSGIEYFSFITKDPIVSIDLGRQHPRLNDFLPRIDEAFFRNRLLPLFSVGLRYKRLGLELQTRINPEYSFSTFEFEGQEFQPRFWRKISSFTLSYSFLKLGN